MAELAEAQAEANTARTAEEANGLTLMTLQVRNKELENSMLHAEGSSKKQAERLGAQVIEVGGGLVFAAGFGIVAPCVLFLLLKKKSI